LDNLLLKRKNKIKFNSSIVINIIRDIKKNGDKALIKYEKKFGKSSIIFSRPKEIQKQIKNLDKKVKKSIDLAYNRIFKFHSKQKVKNIFYKDKLQNKLSYKYIPIDSVGIYVPGGTASYPSSVLMNAIPAIIAGVKRVVVVSPPNQNGKIDPLTLVACYMCGANEIYKIGGAQAIGALAYGTKSIKKVNKIVGPGGSFVSIAKALVCDTVSIDMIAGPTELGIIADTSVDPNLIVNDLFSQAEHSKDTFCFVITTSRKLAEKINKIMNEKISQVSRSSIIKKSLSKNGFIAVCKKESDMITLANELAPEHLQIMTRTSKKLAAKIDNAGLILLGKRTPSAFTDYLLGTNHILPTSGFAKVRGGLSVLDFMKLKTEVRIPSDDSVRNVSSIMKELTDAEQLPNHYEAIRSRFE